MSIQIGELVVDMRADVARIRTDMAEARRITDLAARDIVNRLDAMRGSISRMDFIAVWHGIEKAVGYAGAAISGLKRTAIDSADQLNKLSQSTGWSTETLSAMRYAAELSDVELEGLTKSLKKLSTGMYDARNGNKEMAALFTSLKIPLNTSEEALLAIADRFAAMPDGAQKAALSVKLFGKEGMAMIPFLNMGRAGIAELTAEAQRMGLVISSETARQAEAFNDNLTRLQRNVSGLVQTFGASMMPTLLGLSERLLDAKMQTGGLDENIRRLAGNRSAMDSFLETTAVGIAHVAEQAVLLKRVFAQPFSSAEAIGVDVRTWLEKGALGSMKSMGFDQSKIDAAINDLEHGRAHYMDAAGRQLTGINTSPGYVSGIKQFFDEQRRTVRVEGQKFVLDSEAQAKQVQAIYDKYYAQNPKQAGGVGSGSGVSKSTKANKNQDVFSGAEFSTAQLANYKQLSGFSFISGDTAASAAIRKQYEDANQLQLAMLSEQQSNEQAAHAWMLEEQKHYQSTYSETMLQWQERRAALAQGLDVENEFGQQQQRLNAIRQRLDAEVNLGYKSQVAAQIELREETGRLGDELAGKLLPRLNELINTAPDEGTREKWRALYAEIGGMQATGKQVGPFAGLQAGLNEYANSTTDTFAIIKNSVGSAFKGMEDALVNFVMTGKLEFKDLANSIIADMVRMMIQKSITAPLAAAASSMFGFADGGAPGGVSAWRNQIVSQPTFFKFASGGVMGEAGPEAIMPLSRGSGGRLGVDASGMGGGSVTVNVINNATGTQASTRERTEGNNRIIDVLLEQIDGAMASGITRGSSKTAAAMGNTFGLNRIAGSYN